jgi:hypothetical protein
MRPPICAICHARFGPDEGGLVSFALDDRAREFHARRKAEPGFVGHPPEQEWFCGTHIEAARALSTLTRPEALQRLRATT